MGKNQSEISEHFATNGKKLDTLNGDNELAPFLNILKEMHARQTSKKVKATFRTRFANGAHYGTYAPLGYAKTVSPRYLQDLSNVPTADGRFPTRKTGRTKHLTATTTAGKTDRDWDNAPCTISAMMFLRICTFQTDCCHGR